MSVPAEDNSHVIVVVEQVNDIHNGCPRSSLSGKPSTSDIDEIVRETEKESRSCVSECCVNVDLDNVKVERDCRICHLSMDMTDHDHESGSPIELGCSCKDDLAAAHKHCAEAWFKIKGNKTCEICGSTAHNVAGIVEVEMTEEGNEGSMVQLPPTAERPSFWQGHRFLNFLLACMVFAFIISWLFHFNVPS